MNVFIGGAWPYANGSLHIGHISSLLPGDVIARYHRLAGNDVCYVSGSDCHGTPITIRANQEGTEPGIISDKYHCEFKESFGYLNFSFDHYGKTSSEAHISFVRKFHKELYKSSFIYEKIEKLAYCSSCSRFLPDRLVTGKCPECGNKTAGEQCEDCGVILESKDILEARCSLCEGDADFILTKNLYLDLSRLEKEIRELLHKRRAWKPNAVAFTKRYLNEGLKNRAITRDIDWGVDVPAKGYEDKKVYIWAENVLGYLSGSLQACNNDKEKFESYWKNPNAVHYYVHGKDNIPFHTIILPSLLLAHGGGYNLPDNIISSEYLTLEGRKISTSRSWAIWIKDLVGKYNPDAIRYYLLSSGPERRDADFSWEEFLYCNNSELLGSYGNFVNRTLVFISKSFDSIVPSGKVEPAIRHQVEELYNKTSDGINSGEIKKSLKDIFSFIRDANKYFDREKPWHTIKTDISKCKNTLYNCVYIIINLAVLLEPYLPASSAKLIKWFNIEPAWKEQQAVSGFNIPQIEVLFKRLDKDIVDKELDKLSFIKQ